MMISSSKFDDVLTEIERMTPDEQAELVEIVRRRLIDLRRDQIVANAAEATRELEGGLLKPMTAEEIIRELKS